LFLLLGIVCLINGSPLTHEQMLLQQDSTPDPAALMAASLEQLKAVQQILQNTSVALSQGTNMIVEGLCHFIGFCQTNPAVDCQDIRDQSGLDGATLPDGKYWIGGSSYSGPPERISCYFDSNGNGWTLLFDDTTSSTVSQTIESKLLQAFPIKQVLVYTPDMIEKGGAPVTQTIYYVDEDHLATTPGKTLSQLNAYPWVAQDEWGKENDHGQNFPNKQTHFRWKYFGKDQVPAGYRGTLYILDDGNVQDDSCKTMLSPSTQCANDFFCRISNGVSIPAGYVAQTDFPITPLGVISFGCSVSQSNFTQCGSCNYEGPAQDAGLASLIRTSIIQKMYGK